MKLSVLDQSVITTGGNGAAALRNTLKLAQITEEMGYTRFWVAEHHNTNGIAGSSPEVLISHIASGTKSIRVGSGGVLLPQYSPYKIAENFKVLEALFPNRIDLGVGRSPGGSPETRLALTDGVRKSLNDFPRQVRDLQGYLTNEGPDQTVKAYPFIKSAPEMWMLGITHRGARVAAEEGMAFTYGHFINPHSGQRAINQYLNHFQPSRMMEQPKVNVCIFIVCASTEEKAQEIALSQDAWLLAVEKGGDTRIPTIEEAKNRILSKMDKEKAKENRKRMIIGTPQKVRNELLLLSEAYQTDEFMVLTNVYDFEDKIQSYALLAEAIL
ncbi:LLM class flavin-dependent oxidoreductase [Domibacillus sp. A3M-37]|uniref:LLM class flavin-dependent oxidoreductase n=1 Tax=Domibacillus sp. A3M-37 TaxID=2962037 RepID=UPI0020B7F340|nr:LLM class flavin-dependent oxidoreductase [Domibacillus sp. A3M-37]MCP3762976.1 LLM class flavin-dependent oxidoreductase [Domibacillus sp. A3M-37]